MYIKAPMRWRELGRLTSVSTYGLEELGAVKLQKTMRGWFAGRQGTFDKEALLLDALIDRLAGQ
jgi:hypothetical protein